MKLLKGLLSWFLSVWIWDKFTLPNNLTFFIFSAFYVSHFFPYKIIRRHTVHLYFSSGTITRSEQLSGACVTVLSRTSLFLERFWREFSDIFKFQKPVSKTYRPKNVIFFCLLITFSFLFDILFVECAHRHGGDPIFAEKSALKCVKK